MKLQLSGDWHLDAQPPHDQVDPRTNRSTRFAETVDTLREVIKAGQAAGVEGLVHLGDLTESKNARALELEAAADLFTLAMAGGRRVWAIAGNHDGSLFEISSSSFAPLAKMASVRERSFKLFHKVEFDNELGMLAVPYLHRATPEQVAVAIQSAMSGFGRTVSSTRKAFAAIHYGVTGCTVGVRNLVLQGDYLSAQQLLSEYLDKVFFGHIHQGQTIDLTPTCRAHGPGSAVIQDMGEINDPKTWLMFDTVTREVTIHAIPQRRRWLTVPYYPEIAQATWNEGDEMPWGPQDIVKVRGVYTRPDYPKDTLEAAFKNGLPRPFSLDIDVKQAKSEKVARFEVSAEGGLRDKMQAFVRERFPNNSHNPGVYGPATALALDVMQEHGAERFAPQVDPDSMEIRGFLTFKDYSGSFHKGTPALITGRNGIGKTNWMDAPLWCLTGKTSKGLGLAGVVRQNCTEASVTMYLTGHGGESAATRYRILRSVKLNRAGKPTQKLSLEKMGLVEWEAIGDGGVDETQTKINALIGGGYISLRATAFKFQNDTSPLVRAHPQDRKAVIGEVLGLEPLGKAFKVLDARRLESQRAAVDGKNRLAGMVAAGEGQEERLAAAQAGLTGAQADVLAQEAALLAAQAQATAVQTAVTDATAKVTAQRAVLEALPNTAAALEGAEQALATLTTTHATRDTSLRARWNTLKAEITKTEADLAALKAPDPAQIATLEAQEQAQGAAVVTAQAAHLEASNKAATAQAEASSAEAVLKGLREDLAQAEADLAALPAAVAEDLGAALAKAEADFAGADADVSRLAGLSVSLAGQLEQDKAALAKLADERAAFDGKDVGTCSRCTQPIDSKHIEVELARIDGAVRDLTLAQAEHSAAKDAASKALGAAAVAKTTAQALVKTLGERKQAQALALASRGTLTAKVEDLSTRAHDLANEVQVKFNARDQANAALSPCAVAVAAAVGVHNATTLALRTLREAGTTLGTLTGQLEAERKNLAQVEAEGIKEKAEAEAQTAILTATLTKAREAHAINDATAAALRAELVKLETAAQSGQGALVQALTGVNTVQTAIQAAKQRVIDLDEQITAITGQRAALEAAKFELATLDERALIDGAACGLLDPKQGLPVFLIDAALPFLEERINLYMEQLGMDRLTVELTTLDEDKETLAVLVDNGRPGPRLDIAAFSGGQLDRVEYALKCALADLQRQTRGVTFGLICYDEPTGGLDEAGKEGLIKLLYDRCATYPVSLVVSHDEALIRSFDHRMQFSQGTEEETLVNAA